MIIRKAEIDDLPELKKLFSDTIIATCKTDYTINERKVWSSAIAKNEKWLKSLKEEFFIIAESGSKIIGFSSLKNKDYLNLMYVHKDFTRKGLATKLYKNIKTKSLEYGVEKLNADVSKTAKPFFEKLGFKVVKENRNIIENEILINYKMTE